jgi:hypothetical protein
MNNISRLVFAYVVAIPLALALGYLVATPDLASVAALGIVLFCLALPLIIQWHHALLIIFWNSAFMLGFLPGQPRLWLVMAALSFGVAAINHVLGLKTFLRAPELAKPILILLGVILLTAWIRGGIGIRILGGSSYGGKFYIYAAGAIMGYFALTAQRIPTGRRGRTVKWFFLSGTTSVFSNLIYALGPAFYFLYALVSMDFVGSQAASDYDPNVVDRFSGLGPAATGLLCFILARWGIRRTFQWNKPWRLLLLAAVVAGGLFSGFRSQIAFLGLLFAVEFMVEGLWKTSFLPVMALLGILCLTPMLLFTNKMPYPVQRSLSFLPVNVDSNVRAEAAGSSEWRYEMWRTVWPEVPKYLMLGKGYSVDPTDLYLTEQAAHMGMLKSYEISILSGEYHSGLLSLLMPLGLPGVAAFLWVLWTGIKVLYRNYRYGDARLRQMNAVLLSYFLAQIFQYFFVYGVFYGQLFAFMGILGVSVSLNGGVCRKEVAKAESVSAPAAVVLEPA